MIDNTNANTQDDPKDGDSVYSRGLDRGGVYQPREWWVTAEFLECTKSRLLGWWVESEPPEADIFLMSSRLISIFWYHIPTGPWMLHCFGSFHWEKLRSPKKPSSETRLKNIYKQGRRTLAQFLSLFMEGCGKSNVLHHQGHSSTTHWCAYCDVLYCFSVSNKLQKQLTCLENNSSSVLCLFSQVLGPNPALLSHITYKNRIVFLSL